MEKAKGMTYQGLMQAMKNLCGTKDYWTVSVTFTNFGVDMDDRAEWGCYHAGINHHKGDTPEAAFESFTNAWNRKKGKPQTSKKAAAEIAKVDA